MKTEEKEHPKEKELETKALNHITATPSITVDYDAYFHLLEHSEMDEAQKRNFLQSLWSIIYAFASLGFDMHPVQQIEAGQCGQVGKQSRISTSKDQNTVKFNNLSNQNKTTKRIVADQSGVEHASQ